MAGRYLTDMAAVLRDAGCRVEERVGWQTRARSSGGFADGRPWCIMWHHTASRPNTSALANVAYIVSGSPIAPVANLYLHSDGVFHVCAAGATNTNGVGGPTPVSKGTVPVNQMNTHAISIEAGNDGTGELWPQVQIDAYFKGSNALAAAYGLKPSDICSHNAYTPGRKIDPATANAVQGPWKPRSVNTSGSWSVEDMRTEATKRAATITPPTPGDDDVQVRLLILTDSDAQFLAQTDNEGQALYVTWAGPGSPEVDKAVAAHRAEAQRKRHKFEQSGDIAGLFPCVRVGELPYGDSKHNWTGSEFWTQSG